ncbi:MAG: DUF6129 family protein [Chromatiales bacterium]|jgi:hypothetical protein
MITQEQLQQIGRLMGSQVLAETVLEPLREQFPELHFTFCQDDDVVAARPVYEEASYNLYLIDSRNHCLCFTQDLALATGVVVAEIDTEHCRT